MPLGSPEERKKNEEKKKNENEDENENEGCRLTPTTYYLLPSFPRARGRARP
jgi:hypothetical protein